MIRSFREAATYPAEEMDDYQTNTEARHSSLKFCQILENSNSSDLELSEPLWVK